MIKQFILDLIFPPHIDELKKRYIEKNGYPDEDKFFVDSQGNYGKIIGINTFKKVIDNPSVKYISQQIKEKGYFKL